MNDWLPRYDFCRCSFYRIAVKSTLTSISLFVGICLRRLPLFMSSRCEFLGCDNRPLESFWGWEVDAAMRREKSLAGVCEYELFPFVKEVFLCCDAAWRRLYYFEC